MELTQIQDEDDLERALAADEFLLFKHSLICPTSAQAFHEYRRFLAAGSPVPTAWLDVRGQRPLSLAVEARTGVRHESPQALLLRTGRAVWHASHGAITHATLGAAVAGEQAR